MRFQPKGFTLLELLIGLVLLGFTLALLFGGFRLATRAWNAIETRVERSTDEQAGLALIRRLIGSVQPLRSTRTVRQPLTFSGQPDRLAIVAPLTEAVGLRLIVLSIEAQTLARADSSRKQPGQQLVLREQALNYSAPHFDGLLPDLAGYRLIGDFSTAAFSYFGAMAPDAMPGWHGEWTDTEQLPKLVRLQINGEDGDPIDLIVATFVSGDRTAAVRTTAGPE
jgi:general secretion pathway protein J